MSPSQPFHSRLAGCGIRIQSGPFSIRLASDAPGFGDTLELLYGDYLIAAGDPQTIIDHHIQLQRPRTLRRWWKSQVILRTDENTPFAPFPLEQAFPLFEWGLNWCIAMQAHQYLMLHAAVVERQGKALILPALPGSGKSTLCAALTYSGWRLLSDEFGLITPETGIVTPIPRPIPLKNRSIPVFREFAPQAVTGPIYPKTRKGDVAHVKPTEESFQRAQEPATPAWVVFPKYQQDVTTRLQPFPKGRAFLKIAGNAFNYKLQGARGFRAVARITHDCDCYYLEFSDLKLAVDALDQLLDDQ